MSDKQLLAGAATTCITPALGVSLCGAMQDRAAENVHDELHARCLVLDNSETRLALVVLDLIAARKEWLSEVTHVVTSLAGIPANHVLLCCTHTHSAATPVAFFQSNPAKEYLQWAAPRVADAVRLAVRRLRPARIGWASGREERVLFNRRYLMKPGTKLTNPFGGEDKVRMNPAAGDPNIDRPAGPTDPEITLLAVQRADEKSGQPLAVFACYGLHYVGGNPSTDVSADYFGMVADRLHELTGGPRHDPVQPFVGLLANGCFGDINNLDPRHTPPPREYHQMAAVADTVARSIHAAWREVRYHDWVPLAVAETNVELTVRRPSEGEVRQAKEVLSRAPQGPLRTLPEIYARETVQLADWPARFKTGVQAIRIGELGIGALPGEPFCQTGLEIKAKSTFKPAMVLGMANDYAGYLPTEEHHALGGYETWRAKSSFLEVKAATRLQEAALAALAAVAR